MKNILLVLLFSVIFLRESSAQTTVQERSIEVQETRAEYLGTIPELRKIIPIYGHLDYKKANKDWKQKPANFIGRGKNRIQSNPEGDDPIRQRSYANRALMNELEIDVNVEGITSGTPNDPTGDIGRDHYLQAVNATRIAIYDKEGSLISDYNSNVLWQAINDNGIGDPIIIYDHEYDRWLLTEFSGQGNALLVAITKTSDPLGQWDAYRFGTPNFPDYPKYGQWTTSYTVTSNEQGNGTFVNYFINREDLLNTLETVRIQRLTYSGFPGGPGFLVGTPVDWVGMRKPANDASLILNLNDDAWGDVAEDQVQLHEVIIDWENSSNTTLTTNNITVTDYDSNPCSVPGPNFSCIPQKSGGGLDGLPEVIMNQAVYRNFGSHESIVLNFITDVTDGEDLAGIRWMEIRRDSEMGWSVYQEGTLALEDGFDRFMGASCIDESGNIALAYNCSSETIYTDVRATGRRASDPLGEMTFPEVILAEGTNSISSFGRFGDYSQMGIDPTDDRTFWYTAEYGGDGVNNSTTRIVSFSLGRDTTDLAPIALISPQTSGGLTNDELVEIQIKNFGLDTPSTFMVGYQFEGEDPIVFQVNEEIEPDSIYTHVFNETVDMELLSSYAFKVFSIVENDKAPTNDTANFVRSHLASYDVGNPLSNVAPGQECKDSVDVTVRILNRGLELLTSATVEIWIKEDLVSSSLWSGALLMDETEDFSVRIGGLQEGLNDILCVVSSPNGETDQIMSNDSSMTTAERLADATEISLYIMTDQFPGETTWRIEYVNGGTVASGGPLVGQNSLILSEICLDSTRCYIFKIFDQYSDGICCDFGNGFYYALNSSGDTIFMGDGEYENRREHHFCPEIECMLDVNVVITPETEEGANDGVILLEDLGGFGDVMYSIDDGDNWFMENFFNGLSDGEYEILVQDENECQYSAVVVLRTCTLDALIVSSPEINGSMNGVIDIMIETGIPPYIYSIDGGMNFQDDSLFLGLDGADYDVIIRDSLGCEIRTSVTVDMEVAAEYLVENDQILVRPNPANALFEIEITGARDLGVIIPIEILDAEGKVIQNALITRYDDSYLGQYSLAAYPAGIYFFHIRHEDVRSLARIVKVEE